MDITQLGGGFSTSGQLSVEDLPALAEQGTQLVVCNRPDGETDDQPSFDEIAAGLQALGIRSVCIPFSSGDMSNEHVQALAEALGDEQRVHLYCRSGARSQGLLQAYLQSK